MSTYKPRISRKDVLNIRRVEGSIQVVGMLSRVRRLHCNNYERYLVREAVGNLYHELWIDSFQRLGLVMAMEVRSIHDGEDAAICL